MPITLSVGLSRKVSKDYNSRGYSVNLDVELPADAINDHQSIADSADRIFKLGEQLLDRQIHGDQGDTERRQAVTGNTSSRRFNGSSRSGNGNTRSMTTAQGRAIESMARKLGQDPNVWARHEFGQETETLDIKQASSLIGMLKEELDSREKVER